MGDDTSKNLLRLMSIPISHFRDVTKTSDGFYIAMGDDDIGYNHFLGSPSPPHPGPGKNAMLQTWRGLNKSEKRAVICLAQSKNINLHKEFGVPVR